MCQRITNSIRIDLWKHNSNSSLTIIVNVPGNFSPKQKLGYMSSRRCVVNWAKKVYNDVWLG